MYSKKRKHNYRYINFHRVNNNIYNFIIDLSVLENVSINHIIMSLLEHSNRPQYVFSNPTLALHFKSQLAYSNFSISKAGTNLHHLEHLLQLYWHAKSLKMPEEINSYELYLHNIQQTKHQLLIVTNGLLKFQHHVQVLYNLTSTETNIYNQQYLIKLAKLIKITPKLKPNLPLHHINFRAPYHVSFLLKDLKRHYKISYTQLLTMAVINYKHVPTVITKQHFPKKLRYIINYLAQIKASYDNLDTFLHNQIYDIVATFIKNPKLIEQNNSRLFSDLENKYHSYNKIHLNLIYQQYNLLLKVNKKA